MNTLTLLTKAALKRSSQTVKQGQTFSLPAVQQPPLSVTLHAGKPLDAFHQLVDWQHPAVHPCWLHILAFNRHMALMLSADFPFALVGLVHIYNRIIQHQPLTVGAELSQQCYLDNLQAHRKGWTFDIVTEYRQHERLVWQSVSRQLFRCHQANPPEVSSDADSAIVPTGADTRPWAIAADTGRRYARVSGDYNPIHLYNWSARLLGFKQAIAHGMWSKARCLSALCQGPITALDCAVQFEKPVFLPAQVTFSVFDDKANRFHSAIANTASGFVLTSAQTGGEATAIRHLAGHFAVRSAPQDG